jgi:hypothetical protein
MSSNYRVCKPFESGSLHLKPGDVVDAAQFKWLSKLVDQRYLAPTTEPVSVTTAEPAKRGPGRPRKE